jgi:hypothetical protein
MRIRLQLDLILASALCVCALPLAGRTNPFPQSANTSTRKLSAGSDSSSSSASSAASSSTKSSSTKSASTKSASTPKAATAKSSSTSTAKKIATSRKTVARKTVRPHAPLAPTSGRISEIQSALASQGAYQGDPTGRWDDATVGAMRKFQSANGLNPSGKLDAHTLEKLGLGSDTAGRGAPYPRVAPLGSTPGGPAPQVSAIPKPAAPSPLTSSPITPSTMTGDASDPPNASTSISPAQN